MVYVLEQLRVWQCRCDGKETGLYREIHCGMWGYVGKCRDTASLQKSGIWLLHCIAFDLPHTSGLSMWPVLLQQCFKASSDIILQQNTPQCPFWHVPQYIRWGVVHPHTPLCPAIALASPIYLLLSDLACLRNLNSIRHNWSNVLEMCTDNSIMTGADLTFGHKRPLYSVWHWSSWLEKLTSCLMTISLMWLQASGLS